ncbi:MAG: hypothetical protein ACI8X3_000198, partial [Saprospiraceae bacterium]
VILTGGATLFDPSDQPDRLIRHKKLKQTLSIYLYFIP